MHIPTPAYAVTHWAADLERLTYPPEQPRLDMEASQILPARTSAVDLGVTVLATPGHTPDELAWYHHLQRHLYVGDSFYERGDGGEPGQDAPIMFSREGDWVSYMASMSKLLDFVYKENAAVAVVTEGEEQEIEGDDVKEDEKQGDGDDDNHVEKRQDADEAWLTVPNRVKVSCGHTTHSVDGEAILEAVIEFFEDIIVGKVPVVASEEMRGEVYDLWKQEGDAVRFSVKAPRRLCEDARRCMLQAIESKREGRGRSGKLILSGLLKNMPWRGR